MTAKNEEQLPADWTAKVKDEKNGRKTKYYMNVRTGQKFFSKEDLLRYAKMKRTHLDEPHPTNEHGKRHTENSSSKLVAKENNHENSRGKRLLENRSTKMKLVAKENNYANRRGKRHSENSSLKHVVKEKNHENSRGKRHSENSSMKVKPVEEESNHENRPGKRHLENSGTKPVAEESNHENSRGKMHSENSSIKPVAEENNRPEWLPDGWVVDFKTRKSGSAMGRQYKVYIEPLTGCKFFSMPEVIRHLESVKNRNAESERKTSHTETLKYEDVRKVSTKTERETTEGDSETSKYEDARKFSTKTEGQTTEKDTETSKYEVARKVSTKTQRETSERVVIERSTVDDLPPGWIKETKIKKTARGIRKDPYYTDPVSGYVFISKKDVFRYLDTGKISKNALKPRKEGTDDPELVTKENLPSPDAKRQKLEHAATRRRLCPVKQSSDVCIPAVLKANVLKKRQGKEVSAETCLAGAPTAEFSPEKTAKMAIDQGGETKEISSLSSSALPKFRGSKRNQGKMVFADNGRLTESHIECSNGNTLNDTIKSAKKNKLSFPRRSSKRLAGLGPKLVSHSATIEQAPKNVTTESCKSKGIKCAGLTSTDLVDGASHHLKAGLVPESANYVIPSSGEPSNKFKSSGSLAIPGEQLQKFKRAEAIDDKSEQRVSLYFGDSFIDPCLESAFKALMGELPVNSNPDDGPVLNPTAKSMQTTEEEKSSSRKTQLNSTQSKNKQELNLPRRSSKRLAGFEPEMVVNCESLERAPRNVTNESCKTKGTLDAGLTDSGLVDEVSPKLKTGTVLGLPNRASGVLGLAKHMSSKVNVPSSSEPSNMIKSLGNLDITGGQSAEANGDKSEPHVSLSSGGSLHPCKAKIGETLVDSVPDNEPVITTADGILLDKKLQETKVEESSNNRTRINSMKSKNKQELNLPRRSSKRLARLEPELVSYSVAGVQACRNATIDSCKSEAPTCEKTDSRGPADDASQQVEAGHETMLAQHVCTDIGTLLLEESSYKKSKPLEAQIVSEEPSQKLENEKPEEPPQKLENERTDNENPDSQILFPFGDSWPDPCLEFAFKTLTGAIPVDENMDIQDYLKHQLDPCNSQKDDSSALPDFGPIGSFQTDVSHPLDAPEKQLAPACASQQQPPANPFPPRGNVSFPSCSGVAPQSPLH